MFYTKVCQRDAQKLAPSYCLRLFTFSFYTVLALTINVFSLVDNPDCFKAGKENGQSGFVRTCCGCCSEEMFQVSLSEYRNRRRTSCATNTSSSSTSPKSSSDAQISSRRTTLDSSVSLAPLPLFEPITIHRECRDLRGKLCLDLSADPMGTVLSYSCS